MDPSLINTNTSSESVTTFSVAMDMSVSIGREITPELIAGLEQQTAELRLMVQNTPLPHCAPPVYTYATTPPVTQTQGLYHIDANHYVKMENDLRMYTDDTVNRKLKDLEDAIRSLRGLGNNQSVRYEDLCAFPEIELPPGYKIPKFEKFDGFENSFFHLKTYCEKLIGVGKNEGIRDDLANAFVDHYKFHVDIIPDRISITKLRQRSNENFYEYSIHWREKATRVHPPMEETEMISYFIHALNLEYFDRMITMAGKTFIEIVKT
ncbi:uncharacterized protein LOC124898595 [Capsicum annuum]|uniref:uncharacterized protein LOC124895764 n=1 Tax=Capsicum annuum TaxID=4072 RepID=UPI001FB18B82|nr:uncharacterized protein LOC124895764 [Capsicum annuum]XP_047262156.1 uncharacterized protein LOC124895772 [Capsicum annuum]XP_047262182.1 uncharacterized protein LOC124895803 [Capsicum annuum]XP_047262191.1 uncharacterized protein LOC124895824 [Capsicum annuum]XP_047262217.1 uncharacterized protein LOC124895858 [Capsicum annuum]XP_047268187.1 uncharacterized protein LOC124898595 [Capsicum annuum]